MVLEGVVEVVAVVVSVDFRAHPAADFRFLHVRTTELLERTFALAIQGWKTVGLLCPVKDHITVHKKDETIHILGWGGEINVECMQFGYL